MSPTAAFDIFSVITDINEGRPVKPETALRAAGFILLGKDASLNTSPQIGREVCDLLVKARCPSSQMLGFVTDILNNELSELLQNNADPLSFAMRLDFVTAALTETSASQWLGVSTELQSGVKTGLEKLQPALKDKPFGKDLTEEQSAEWLKQARGLNRLLDTHF
jgi:hypothetical protein